MRGVVLQLSLVGAACLSSGAFRSRPVQRVMPVCLDAAALPDAASLAALDKTTLYAGGGAAVAALAGVAFFGSRQGAGSSARAAA